MELIIQHTKKIMEECKLRARDAGLQFQDETLEYIVTNRDMINLSPKAMIPTLYNYWVNDVEVLRETGKYKLYPHNPYETVINSRPAISFYNDNNPDWMNVMIFYHVLAHIDFFQNNILFERTWNDDFVGQALADNRLIESLRSKHGRWVDYVIEFSRSIDNITGYFRMLPKLQKGSGSDPNERINFYFDNFLQEHLKVQQTVIFKEIERYNYLVAQNKELAESMFFSEVRVKYPEFQAIMDKQTITSVTPVDVMEYIMLNSPFLKKEQNNWMLQVMAVVRNTSLYFAPQIRSKIMNEGWASFWHDELFRSDPRIVGHEVDYARLNAGVTSLSRIGLNPYAIGLRLIQHIEELTEKGKLSIPFQRLRDSEERDKFNLHTGKGRESIFELRKNFSDFMLINTFIEQDFVDKYDLFVVGKRLNEERGMIEYYVKSRKAEDYKNMLMESLYHPPYIKVDTEKTTEENLYLVHQFEGKQLFKSYIPDTMLGIEFLWGGQVQLETTDVIREKPVRPNDEPAIRHDKVLYTMKDRKINKTNL
jgi:stage V sporulation protein R